MWMQLVNKCFLFLIVMSLSSTVFAQEGTDSTASKNSRLNPVVVNFLFGYYEQDGNNSAVTGGEGTEELTDLDSRITIYVPVDTVTDLSFDVGINHYSSASTDAIDSDMSSASSSDTRVQLDIGYSKLKPSSSRTLHFNAGASLESDYISSSLGFGWSKESKDRQRFYNFSGRVFFDTWVVIFPDELRATGLASVDTDKRRTVNLAFGVNQIVNKRIHFQIASDLVWQNGLLSTPFHRIYYDNDSVSIEKLPANRFKIPIGFRLNYFVLDPLVLRFYYRIYQDNFGITANTINIETPIKLGHQFTVFPYYRFHHQTAAKYFKPYGQHSMGDEFHTSDYDLSGFYSHKIGIGVGYTPIIGRINKQHSSKHFRLKNIGIRYSNYWRTDGLKAYQISFSLGMHL